MRRHNRFSSDCVGETLLAGCRMYADMDLGGALGLDAQELVAFVGAGGKKTAMHQLLEEGRSQGLDIGWTTTTHMPPPDGLELSIIDSDSVLTQLARAEGSLAFAAERVQNPDRADVKVRGFQRDIVDRVHEQDRFGWLLVKADGARRREFKAPGPDEPVIPRLASTVVVVASVQVLGEPLREQKVHRPDRVAAITGTGRGEPISSETVATVLASDRAGLKDVPDDAAVICMLNKADTPELQREAEQVVAQVFGRSERYTAGIISSFETGYCRRITHA